MDGVGWARELAGRLLAVPLPRRWSHTQGVAARAGSVASVVGEDGDLLVCAAWLHDIGYAPDLAVTGFHPLDGARYLRDVAGVGGRLCALVANHTCASVEARHRGLSGELAAEFPEPAGLLLDVLTYCDVTTGPDGDPVDVAARLDEIIERYGDGHLVTASIREARPYIEASARTVAARLAA